MTKQVGFLIPHNESVSSSCTKCVKIKQQAEDAFRELRTQADLHIAAVERKLEAELNERLLQQRQDHSAETQIQNQVNALAAEYEERIGQMEMELQEAENRAKSEVEQISRKSKKEARILEVRIADLEAEIEQLKQESGAGARWSIEKAKLDLAYRKRMGEMESEVRRTEIESVRLRKQILSLTQKLEENQEPIRFKRSLMSHHETAEHLPVGRITKLSSRDEVFEDVA